MASWKTLLIVKLMTLWNFFSELYTNIKDKSQNFYYYLKDYFYGHHDMWLFIPGHTFPLSMSNLYNMVHVNWIYDNTDNDLTLGISDDVDLLHCRFSWLSAKIIINSSVNRDEAIEYTIDDFIEKFSVHTLENRVPTLYMIFMCWCAHTKHWFKPDDNVEFHIIDDMGEEQCLSIDDHNDSLTIRRNKIYVVIHNSEEDKSVKNIIIDEKADVEPLIEEKNKED